MIFELWRDVVLKGVFERFSPIALKVIQDEKVQALLTQALNLQADMRQNVEAQVRLVARTLELVTRDEMSSLRSVVRSLEAEVARLKAEVERQAAGSQATPVPEEEPASQPARPTEEPSARKSAPRKSRSRTPNAKS